MQVGSREHRRHHRRHRRRCHHHHHHHQSMLCNVMHSLKGTLLVEFYLLGKQRKLFILVCSAVQSVPTKWIYITKQFICNCSCCPGWWRNQGKEYIKAKLAVRLYGFGTTLNSNHWHSQHFLSSMHTRKMFPISFPIYMSCVTLTIRVVVIKNRILTRNGTSNLRQQNVILVLINNNGKILVLYMHMTVDNHTMLYHTSGAIRLLLPPRSISAV